jgi:hypothetical protein
MNVARRSLVGTPRCAVPTGPKPAKIFLQVLFSQSSY